MRSQASSSANTHKIYLILLRRSKAKSFRNTAASQKLWGWGSIKPPPPPPPPPPFPLYYGGGKTLRVRTRANWNIYLYSSLQVIKVTPSGNLFLVEVISANFNENGTISTVVEAEKLQNFHRRKRRSTDDDQMSLEVFNTGQIKHTVKKSDVFILYRFCNQC